MGRHNPQYFPNISGTSSISPISTNHNQSLKVFWMAHLLHIPTSHPGHGGGPGLEDHQQSPQWLQTNEGKTTKYNNLINHPFEKGL